MWSKVCVYLNRWLLLSCTLGWAVREGRRGLERGRDSITLYSTRGRGMALCRLHCYPRWLREMHQSFELVLLVLILLLFFFEKLIVSCNCRECVTFNLILDPRWLGLCHLLAVMFFFRRDLWMVIEGRKGDDGDRSRWMSGERGRR